MTEINGKIHMATMADVAIMTREKFKPYLAESLIERIVVVEDGKGEGMSTCLVYCAYALYNDASFKGLEGPELKQEVGKRKQAIDSLLESMQDETDNMSVEQADFSASSIIRFREAMARELPRLTECARPEHYTLFSSGSIWRFSTWLGVSTHIDSEEGLSAEMEALSAIGLRANEPRRETTYKFCK